MSVEAWRKVWREGVLPGLSENNLSNLLTALLTDDSTLIQGATSMPVPLQCTQEWPCEAGCALGYMGWKDGLNTVGEVEEFFARLCFDTDQRLDEPAGCRWFLNWFDETPRDEMRALLTAEVKQNLADIHRRNNEFLATVAKAV